MTTSAAWLGGQEVVDIQFDPKVITFESLLATARKFKCLDNVYARTDAQVEISKKAAAKVSRSDEESRPAKDGDRWYYLKKSPAKGLLKSLPPSGTRTSTIAALSRAQATKVNAAIGLKQDPKRWMTPLQAVMYDALVVDAARVRK